MQWIKVQLLLIIALLLECLMGFLWFPEVNPDAMSGIKVGLKKGALIVNLDYSTIICLMVATPLHRHAKVMRNFHILILLLATDFF